MTKKEKFLAVKTYEEFDRRRKEFEGLTAKDPDVLRHLSDIFPKLSNTKEELCKNPPGEGGSIGR